MLVISATTKQHSKVSLKITLNQNMKVSGILVICATTMQHRKVILIVTSNQNMKVSRVEYTIYNQCAEIIET